MSYENAAATKMLATHCLICARPLVDARSVETGVGPECRKKHGFDNSQKEPDWAEVARLNPSFFAERDPRVICNRLVYRMAAKLCSQDEMCRAIDTIKALGFVKLSDKLGLKVAEVSIVSEGGWFVVKSKYNETFLSEGKRIPGRRWDAERKVTLFPESEKARVWAALKRSFPGKVLKTPKGLVRM